MLEVVFREFDIVTGRMVDWPPQTFETPMDLQNYLTILRQSGCKVSKLAENHYRVAEPNGF